MKNQKWEEMSPVHAAAAKNINIAAVENNNPPFKGWMIKTNWR